MGKIVVSENVTLDGVIQDPMGEEGTAFGGWFTRIGDKDYEGFARVLYDEALGARAMLMGRRTDEWLAVRWLSRTGEWADRLNILPKYVVSSTIEKPKWTNSTVLSGDVETEVSKLKEQIDGDIVVNGSGQLVRALLEHDLVDELRLMVYPFVAGAGERVFAETGGALPLRLEEARTVGDSLVLLTYTRAEPAPPVRDK